MDEKKRIIEFDAAESVPVDGQLPIDSASQGTKKITPALLLKAITDLLGDEALDTLAQTLTGAVNEVKGIADDAQDLAENISDEYSATSAYAKGDYCIHNNTLYKCTTAIGSGGEAWNVSHWSATKCDDELSELKGTLDSLIGTGRIATTSPVTITPTLSGDVHIVVFGRKALSECCVYMYDYWSTDFTLLAGSANHITLNKSAQSNSITVTSNTTNSIPYMLF